MINWRFNRRGYLFSCITLVLNNHIFKDGLLLVVILSPPNEGSAGSSFVNRTRTVKFPHLVPQMRLGLGTLYLESRCQDRDREWILISPANEIGTGPYLVPGLSKEWEQDWKF